MNRPLSLTIRLTLFISLAASIVFSIFGLVIERSINHHFMNEDEAELKVIIETVSQVLINSKPSDDPKTLKVRFNDILVGHHNALLNVSKLDGPTIFASQNGPDLSLAPISTNETSQLNIIQKWHYANQNYRVMKKIISPNNAKYQDKYIASVAVVIDHHLHFIENYRYTIWIMIIVGIIIMSIMGWFAVRQAHLPLRNIINQLQKISINQLDTRLLATSVPYELSGLTVSFNKMLERLEEAFKKLSHYSDDIAHELRTPVTNIYTQTQVALSQPRSVEEYQEILYSNLEEFERMGQMIGDMLFLAKTENGLYQPKTDEINLKEEALELIDYYEALAEENNIALTVIGDENMLGDKLMIRRVLNNLISNAIRHSIPGSIITVYLQHMTNNEINITVENYGATIEPQHIPRLFDRFYQIKESTQRHSDGTGLGLAIVKSIIDIHNGLIEVTSKNNCTQFVITLPVTNTGNTN